MSATAATAAAVDPPRSISRKKRVALITGGTRGIGKGIAQVLAEHKDIRGLLLTYNTNNEAAEQFAQELRDCDQQQLKVCIVGGDLALEATRDAIFETLDREFCNDEDNYDLSVFVHNAGQYVGVTSDNAHDLNEPKQPKRFGNGSLLKKKDGGDGDDGSYKEMATDLSYMQYYHKLYAEAWVDLCERCLVRMKAAYHQRQSGEEDDDIEPYRGSIIGISSPGCNAAYKMTPGYDMPGSAKSVMEFTIRPYALEIAKFGINANIIVPGFTKSGAWECIAEKRQTTIDKMMPAFVKNVPISEPLTGRDIGDVVQFLSSPNGGGRFMTGLTLRVDGGLHLGQPPSSQQR